MSDREAFTSNVPINRGGGPSAQEIGRLGIRLSDDRIAAHTRQRLALAVVLGVSRPGATVGAALLANRRVTGRPLALLLESINRVWAGGRRRRVARTSPAEIGRIVTAFNDVQRASDRTGPKRRRPAAG